MADTIVVNEIVDTIVIAVGGEQGPPGITDFNPNVSLIGDVTANGSTGANITVTLATTGVLAGSYTKVVVDSKGRVTGGTNPATLATMGIIDAYTKIEMDSALANATPSFSTLTGKPNSIAGYGILDGVSTSQIGVTIAGLGSNGLVSPSQLPSYIDNIVEYSTVNNFPTLGVAGTIYIDTSTKASYRWSGSAYINVGKSGGTVTVNFTDILSKPTTLSGYGILDGVSSTLVGVNSGLATLGPTGKLTTSQMPAAVDQIVEVSTYNNLPVNGFSSVIYLVLDDNKIYRFSGSAYVEISSAGIADEAIKLHTPRTLSSIGDVLWTSEPFDGSTNVSSIANLKASGVTAGTYNKVTVNSKGIVTAALNEDLYTKLEVDSAIYNSTPSFTNLRDKPNSIATFGITDAYTKSEVNTAISNATPAWGTLQGKPTTIIGFGITDALSTANVGVSVASLVNGLVPASQLPSYVDDVVELSTLAAFPSEGETGKIYVALDTNLSYRWSGSTYIIMGGTTTDAGLLTSGTLDAARLPALTGSDVTSNAGSGELVLSTTGVTSGTYTSVTVDTKGRVSAGSNPGGVVVSVAALSITTNGDDVSSTVLNSTTTPVITLNLPTANATSRGALSATDWSIFNGKQAALVSGTTIKTINGSSILGSGDIVVASSYTLPPATPTTLGGVKVDGTTITVDGAGKITAVGGGGGGTGAFASFSIVDGELVVEHSSSFTLSIVDGEFISEYN